MTEDIYKDDLYGDLDLEDLDASQLEELVEPPELDTAPTSTPAASNAAAAPSQPAITASSSTSAPVESGSQQYNHQPSYDATAPYQQGQQDSNFSQQQDGQDRIKPSDMPDEGKMFIGGLNWETTEAGLSEYMGQFGEIDACTIMRDPSGRSRGFAFLTYRDPASVTKVMAQTHHLDGKQIDPKRAIPRAEHERTAKVFVGGLAPSVTGESLKSFLCQFGQVMDATVMFDKETGRSKGFAFATFQDEESVGRAMAASGVELEGKQIEIKKAQPRGTAQGSKFGANMNPRFNQGTGFNGGMGGFGGGFDPSSVALMYQNMMKTGGNMMGGFDPSAMAMMYQNMMKSMGNAPAINPSLAMRNNAGGAAAGGAVGGAMPMGMGMPGMGGMGALGGMGGMGGMGMGGMGMGGMGMGGMGGMGMGGGMNRMGNNRQIPNAPRGPAAMRGPGQQPMGGAVNAPQGGGPGAQRYSTQGNARARPY
ncbi:RNA-binding protein Musashi [Cryptococcus deuterogattii 99/473]|uniref:RNA-binding protein Musashi n=1 Tax=Cryptococcus deuterogattii Ram5 TaxID=1296110 RepID=A0A0D0UT81_9TREE|nr:RNA-binding protein Musashi [Cryptococcus deuterogattii LA55]KIR38411.1 RNA-binding protein Musashi [Cryptococcus deuterogattii Ram5]KIR90399.1 RNA-binding protein Musashi [Cryptococcus deuterogattii CBS 10090]KIY55031.1 RNA-binding protein Musashi [Cryptococcus deuterogattii 99/473]